MQKIKFKGVEYTKVEVTKISDSHRKEIDKLSLKSGNCLGNSYEIAKKISGINIVEGFLITYFEDGKIESVGHVWNEIDGVYFDETINLKKNDKKIAKSEYYLADKYTLNDISTELKEKSTVGLSSFFEKPIMEKHIIFKTDVKRIELELKEFFNKTEK